MSSNLKELLMSILLSALRNVGDNEYVNYIIEDGIVNLEVEEITEEYIEIINLAGTIDGFGKPSKIVVIEDNDDDSIVILQVDNSGDMAAVVATTDYFDEHVSNIEDQTLSGTTMDEHTFVIPMRDMTPKRAHCLTSLALKAMLVRSYQEKQEEDNII